ncbi:hypothetical protein Axy13_050 [Achromobacter phage vB_AxyP_19-32_Axy13]|uniref:Virion-associated RNA polymerase n=1 Tax=Achromobacter phage vB_AxyP_19-32_Axy13 TaxID=2591044 RepID=A0A514CUJ9_9CAUD|nr:hypothetical protein Axy13_050 [Achromobacter phage vB_AxyP_19-32_Axy13]
MPSTFDRLAGFADAIYDTKRAEVTAATEQKKAVAGGPEYQAMAAQAAGTGMATASQQEIDLRTMDSQSYANKYGVKALLNRGDATGQYISDTTMPRTFSQGSADTVTDVATGLANAVGGIAALGTGIVSDKGGAYISEKLGEMNDWAQGTQSPALRFKREAQQGATAAAARDNKAVADARIEAGMNPTLANLTRVGSDIIDAVKIGGSDSTTLGSGISQGVGSLLAAGPLIKGVGALGSLVVPKSTQAAVGLAAAIDAGSGTMSAARVMNAAAKAAPGAVAIGAMEGGGAYQQTVDSVLRQSHEELAQKSDQYRALVASGMSPDDARIEVATAAGKTAALIQAPIAALTSPLVSKFETAPFSVGSVRGAVGNMARETVEEGIQSGTGQFAQNKGVQTQVDKNQDLYEGVGEQAGLGALYGMGTAGAVQAPGVAGRAVAPVAKTTMAGLRAVGGAVGTATAPVRDALVKRGEKVMQQNEKASPVADAKVQAAADEAVVGADAAEAAMHSAVDATKATDEEKAAARQYATDLVNAAKFDPAELDQPGMPDSVKAAVADATTRPQAFTKLSDFIMNAEEGTHEHLAASLALHDMTSQIENFFLREPAALNQVEQGNEASALLDQYSGLAANMANTPKVGRAMRAVQQMLAKAEVAPVTEASLATPEGQQNVQVAVAKADVAPETSNPEVINTILKHAAEGKIQLSGGQRAALQSAAALLQGAREYDAQAKSLGLRPQDVVSMQIKTDESRGEGQQSALQHAKGIRSAYNAGNMELAAARLDDFLKFAQHMQNKVGALNEHLATGNGDANRSVKYEALTPSRDWVQSKKGLGVDPQNAKSVKFAQQVGLEARTVGEIANNLASAYPELSVGHINLVPLDSRLDKPAAQVVKDFRQAALDGATKTETPAPAKVVDETPTVKAEEPTVTVPPKQEQVKEAVQEPVTKAAPVEKPVAEVAPAPETVAPVKREGTAAAFPDLVGSVDMSAAGVKNYFVHSFKLPTEAKTRTISDEAPLDSIRKALSSPERLADFIGTDAGRMDSDISKQYKAMFTYGDSIAQLLRDNLTKFLSEKNVGKRFANGEEANRWAEGKLLNIVEQDGNSFKYNESLLQNAVLAGLQWQLTAIDRGSIKDAKDAKALTGLEEGEQPAGLVEALNNGLTLTEAANSLAQKIESYWGLDRNRNAPLGYTRGIPLAMASEMLRALVAHGGVEVNRIYLSESGVMLKDEKGAHKTIDMYSPKKQADDSALRAYPTAIEEAVLIEPEEKTFFGEDRPSVPRDQLRNPGVENTPEQRAALKKEIETPFYLHQPMVDFYSALGQDRVLELMGAGRINEQMLNVNHALSLDGQNRSLAAGFNHLEGLVAQVENQVDDITTLPIHYGYNMTRVGRMQMLGKYNPQSTKLVREAVFPTQSTLDLSNENGQDFSRFLLGIAQATGVKVHNKLRADSEKETLGNLNGKFKPAVDMLQDWLTKGGDLPLEAVGTLKQALGGDLSFVALAGLVEYARFLNSDAEGRKSFKTPLYVEADGVTNGPINAMALMSAGPFDARWLANMAKGGLFIGGRMTMNEHRSQVDSKDMYQASTDELAANLDRLRKSIAHDPALTNQMNQLQNIMDLFLPDLSLNDDGNLELKRGIAKNPLTITIYGSGAKGIAGKMVSSVVEAMYERMSQAVQAVADDPSITPALALFGKQAESEAHANEMMAKLDTALTDLTSYVPVIRKEQMLLEVSDVTTQRTGLNPRKFTLQADELSALSQNMLHLFVQPMRDAINTTVGPSLMESTQQLQKAIQVQSLFLQEAFKDGVQAKLEEKAKDPNWKKGDFLTQGELDEINKSLSHLAPMIDTGSQTFYVAGSQNTEVAGMDFARALDGKMRVAAQVYGPSDAGVAGIPFMTIGTGDGMMMQGLSNMKGAPTGTLKIFDGINLPLDQIESGSEMANRAVYESWMGNPLQAVSDSYQKFLKNADFKNMNEELTNSLKRSLLEPKLWKEKVAPEYLEGAARALGEKLKFSAMSAEARHRAMDRVNLSVDQMAAVGSPYVVTGKLDLSALTTDEKVATLNKLYVEEMRKLMKPEAKAAEPVKAEPAEKLNPAFDAVGRVHAKSGARVLSTTAIKNLAKISNLSGEQALVLNEIQKSLAAKEYKVIYGTADQVSLYAQLTGKQMLEASDMAEAKKGNIDGWTTFDDKAIYLVSPSNETLIHELVHAATFESVLAHYMGNTGGEQGHVVGEAVGRLEKLMDQFQKLDVSGQSAEFQTAYADAKAAINGYLQDGFGDATLNKAAALNEFMAWGLTNRELTANLKGTTASPLVQLVKGVLAAIKSVIFGRKVMPKVGDDMFSNLLFNSSIIMRTQPSVMQVAKDASLFHSTAYGDNARVQAMTETFDKLVGNYLNVNPIDRVDRQTAVDKAIMSSINLVRNVQAHGFPMTRQESALFESSVAALATEVAINPAALSRAQELYTHVTKTMKVEDFMRDPDGNDPADRYYAQEKYNVVMGNYLVEIDTKGRTSLLPTFLGLALASDEFRAVLAKLPVPKADLKLNNSLDNILTNVGTKAMESLGRRMAGDTKATNVQEAMDALASTIQASASESQSIYDAVATPTGNMIDRANDYIVQSVERLSDAAIDKADGILRDPAKGKIAKGSAEALRLVAAVATEKNGERVARGVISAMNQGKVWQPFHDLVNDLTGRTSENADVYDMIKGVRSQVQQDRQQFREHLPTTIAEKFSRKLEDHEWGTLHTALGKTDIAVLRDGMTAEEVRNVFADQKALDTKINDLEAQLQSMDQGHYALMQKKAQELADYMINGKVAPNLLRNAETVARLFGEKARKGRALPTDQMIKTVDQLVSLYAVEKMSKADRESIASLVQNEAEGIDFSMAYMQGQRVDEMAKARSTDEARFNHYKGYIPTSDKQGVNLIVANDTDYSKLAEKSFIRVGDYGGSSADRGRGSKGYYFSTVSARAPFSQGILQNVRSTAGGVDTTTGFSQGMTAGRITDRNTVKRITQARANGESGSELLMPIYDAAGQVVAYERSVDPVQLQRLERDNHFARQVGVWRGRQVEEAKAQKFNDALVDRLHDMYKKDVMEGRKGEYINVLGNVNDAVLADALALMNVATRERAEALFGEGEFWVRKDMLNDSFGYRMASVGDAWTGNSRLSNSTQDTIKKMALGVFGNKAYKYVMTGENTIQNAVRDAKTLIVVKSVVVPVVNFLANIYQMVGRGVPLKAIVTGLPKKTAEINSYVKSRIRQVEAEAELRAAEGDVVKERKLRAEIQSITDSHKRLSIYPLIERGEFSSISDAGISRDDVLITEGKIQEYMDKLVNKLPPKMQTAGRYALITKDTALFQGIQKAVEYSDFIAKALIHDDLVKRQGKSVDYANGRVTEEFINYDRLPGRFRGYAESIGLMWFYNFKIRSAKVAVSMIRNNPLHALIAGLAPTPTMFGNVGLPIEDNIFSMLYEGKLGNSIGPGMGIRAPSLNPWHALTQ